MMINTRKWNIVFSLAFLFFIVASNAQETKKEIDEKAYLIKTDLFGDFTKAEVSKEAGKVHLQVWRSYLEYAESLPKVFQDILIIGVKEIEIEFDEKWTVKFVAASSPQEEQEWLAKDWYDILTFYWKDGKVKAYTYKKPFESDPISGKKFIKMKHFTTDIFDRELIMRKVGL